MAKSAPETVSLRDANQGFSKLVERVRSSGRECVVTRRGEPVVKIVPVQPGRRVLTPAQEAALRRTLRRMEKGFPIGAGPLDRDSLHER
jgi:prevent-host-death family protein